MTALASGETAFHLQVAYADVGAGPLTHDLNSLVPLEDRALVQLIEDSGRDGFAAPAATGDPGAGDAILADNSTFKSSVRASTVTVNGRSRLHAAGYFLQDTELRGYCNEVAPIRIRIWNAPDPNRATGYYESPSYEILPGFQQINFGRAEYTFHPWQPEISEGDANSTSEPEEISLRAYPNPFNAEATIQFVVNEPSQVRVLVYDVQGRLVSTLADRYMTAGEQRVNFSAGNLPSGLYFVALHHGSRSRELTRVMLVK